MTKQVLIQLPDYVSIFYISKKKMIIFIGPLSVKTLKLNLQLFINKKRSIIKVSTVPFFGVSNNTRKTLKAFQNLTTALIKQFIMESSVLFYQKLKLVGVGYRAFPVNSFEDKLLLFKIGYSHFIYFRKPTNIKIFCLKTTKLFLYGNSYEYLTQVSSLIRSYKKPEPYKGKGILYNHEKIVIKEGKKI